MRPCAEAARGLAAVLVLVWAGTAHAGQAAHAALAQTHAAASRPLAPAAPTVETIAPAAVLTVPGSSVDGLAGAAVESVPEAADGWPPALVQTVPPAAVQTVPGRAVDSLPAAGGPDPAAPGGNAAAAAPGMSSRVAQAVALEHGEGVARDPERAAALYCEAARDGDTDALFNLGWMYANGRGIARDYDVAATLFARAAQGGHAQATKVMALFRQGHEKLPECLQADATLFEAAPFDLVRAEVDPFADLPAYKQKIAEMVSAVAPAYGIEPRLALAVITVESNFDARARSDKDARGLMQLIPQTAARFKVKDAFDARDNVRGGLAYLRWLLAYYRGQVALAAAAYNAGEKAVDRYHGVPPYPETRDYVRRVLQLFARERHPFDASLVAASPIVGSAPDALGQP